ncbi:SPOR domain-containing protein [Tenacibaculum finnmarkense]|uniref:SPOR domain-containing protein n=1 Tax=Tenacibaculum finnmarkense TaxID=2781243 RepID=UPI00187BAD9D|nr:SPOR domain-containing protein [Tenacibaculum finnmarkense]MBE7645026.1 SPOR domain-containing protein [Tenacibaculum finnmarkense genomovar ulcerans]MBE7686958.1 SPOR domain-containing protein [Tenacibaculum finnmarkense genomovar ulcerans]MCD8399311.1 SPOR domain-containing protein [Tenacibaculum finnmarkense genomovar ulcerans]MCD8409012.1 SPOR domain-containing protein [Tenacibaculum finnmarkense genomovar ulcerans]MCD8444393.1 SPOR domain-containing protein [Tenacibaculum finnmarkense 
MEKRGLILILALSLSIGVLSAKAQQNQKDNKDIASLIAKKRTYNKNNGTGYRIQLYNGLETKAKSLRNRFRLEYPGVFTKITYDQPDWKTQVGDYRTKLQADRALNKIREKFNGSIVIPL